MRIKEWPIVMTCSLQYLRTTREWLSTLPFYSLDQLKSSETTEPSISMTISGTLSVLRQGLESMNGFSVQLICDYSGRSLLHFSFTSILASPVSESVKRELL